MTVDDPEEPQPGDRSGQRDLPDSAAMQAAFSSNEAALGEFYVRYKERIQKFVRRRLHNFNCPDPADHSQDVTADVFIKARTYDTFKSEKGTILNWIFGISRNEVRNHLNRRCAREESLDALMSSSKETGQPSFAEPRAPLADYDKLLGLDDKLKEMPEKFRQAFVLRIAYGYEYTEIAEMMEISAAYAKKLCFKARHLLKTEE